MKRQFSEQDVIDPSNLIKLFKDLHIDFVDVESEYNIVSLYLWSQFDWCAINSIPAIPTIPTIFTIPAIPTFLTVITVPIIPTIHSFTNDIPPIGIYCQWLL